MLAISFPPNPVVAMRQREGKPQLRCLVRRRWVNITEEEWVRQNIIAHLHTAHAYPLAAMAVEKMLRIGERPKRFDLIVYAARQPWMVVECKEPQVALSPAALQQALGYNSVAQAPFLLLSNGREHLLWQLQPHVQLLTALPAYPAGG